MNVLLVNPYQATPAYIQPNLGLGYLAGALLQKGHAVSYLDCPLQGIQHPQWVDYLKQYPAEVIGIQVYTFNYQNVVDMLQAARAALPSAVLVCGGPHITVEGGRMLAQVPELDFAVQGEGEQALPALLEAILAHTGSLEKHRASSGGSADPSAPSDVEHSGNSINHPAGFSNVPNLIWRSGAEVVANPLVRTTSLEDLPQFPWHLMPPASYPMQPHGVLNKAYPIAPLTATRGCPCACTFCSAGAEMGKQVRRRQPAQIVDEMERLVREFGVREIHFEDDNITLDRDFMLAICDGILQRNLNVAWACPNGVRIDRLDPELIRRMEASGCYSLSVGIESGSASMLRLMKKGLEPQQVLESLIMIRRNSRIRITGFFLIGHPGETPRDLDLTRDFLLSAPLDRISLSPFMPLPGTSAVADLQRQGLLPQRPEWHKLVSYQDSDYVSYCEIPSRTLLRVARRISFRFYFRPRVILGILGGIHSWNQVRILWRYLLYLLGLSGRRHW